MAASACIALLQWALPRLGLAWPGFRRVHRQVCRRLGRRLATLRLGSPEAYRRYLEAHPEEWAVLDSFCRIPVSRFFRDRKVFDRLASDVFPELAEAALSRHNDRLRAWSAGCASGEEPYSLTILWRLELAPHWPGLALEVTATDADERLLERARLVRYRLSSLRELPDSSMNKAFARCGNLFELLPEFREGVEFRYEDIRQAAPPGRFDLVLCRNLAFTYFDGEVKRRTLDRIAATLPPGGALVIGQKEDLPAVASLIPWFAELKIFRSST